MRGLYRGLCALGLLLSLGIPGVGWCWQIQSQPCLDGPSLRLLTTNQGMTDLRVALYMGPKEQIPEVMEELKKEWRQSNAYRRATYVPRGPLAIGVGPGQLGLMEPPCPERGLWASTQVGSRRAGARSEAVVAFNTSLLLIPLPKALPGLTVSGHLSTLLDGLGAETARVGPASVSASYQLWRIPFLSRDIDGVARPFARVHLPSSFVETPGVRLGLEPGIISRWNHYSNDDAFHLGVSFPLLSAETLDGHRPGFHVSTRMGLSLRDSALNTTTVELGMLHDSRGLEQFTVGGAYRFAVPRVGMELALTLAVGGRDKGSGSLAMRFTFDPMQGLVDAPDFP